MRFDKDEVNDLLNEYIFIAIENFKSNVQNHFLHAAKIEYSRYSSFTDTLLEEIYQQSIFNELIMSDANYVLEKSPEYWANHIIQEVNSNVDFQMLEIIELEEKIEISLEEIEVELVNFKYLESQIKKYSNRRNKQLSYLKHKKDFLAFNGINSNITDAYKALKTFLMQGFERNYLVSGIIENEVLDSLKKQNGMLENADYDNLSKEQSYEAVAY